MEPLRSTVKRIYMKKKYIKTFDGKIMPIKEIHEVLKTQDSTKIYRLYKSIYGKPVTSVNIYFFIEWYAPNKKIRNAAMEIAVWNKPSAIYNRYELSKRMERNREEFCKENPIQYVMQIFRHEIARGLDNYSKFPIIGDGKLYFASPIYKLKDYNKFEVIPIKGNEQFCETLCRYVEKYLKTHNSI